MEIYRLQFHYAKIGSGDPKPLKVVVATDDGIVSHRDFARWRDMPLEYQLFIKTGKRLYEGVYGIK